MTTWYLASHGEVTGPFELEEARKSIQSNKTQDPQFFVWQPNFVYWQAAYAVGEFSDLVQEVEHASPVFDDLKDRFKEREEILSNRVSHVDGRLKQACDNLMTFEDDIIAYKKLTANFGPEVQAAIAAIEKKYKSLSKKIDGIVSATEIAETEVANASKAFAAIESDEAEEELIEEEVAVEEEPIAQEQEVVEKPKVQKKVVEQKQPEAKPVAKKEPAPKPVAKPSIQKAAEVAPAPQASSQEERAQEKQEQEAIGKGILGMKKMLKSVFKEPEPAPKLSEMLNQTESAPVSAEEPPEEDVELVVVDVDEEEATAKKRRRRRRR